MRAAFLLLLILSSCRQAPEEQRFPRAHRPVSPIIGDSFSTEDARDRLGEAEQAMALAGVKPGMWVADVGAGEGYYTMRLAPAVGPRGRVLAEDIMEETHQRLLQRVQRERLDNVAVRLGKPDDPMLPPRSFDRIFLVHMYHEVQSPYAFLWHLREGLKPDGLVVVVDSNRPTKRHGISPELLSCEFAAVGLKQIENTELPGGEAYLAKFQLAAARPEPSDILPCSDQPESRPMRRRLVHCPPPKTRWSTTAQSSASAADARRLVAAQSSGLGVASPLG
jgi:2-polyprenyl-3-methyl-5-hydroxy-6-metoxy-1,4-benzoquinol methylase